VKYLFFTNECVGLGHLRRALVLARALTERDPDASVLIVTGAPIELAHPLPPRVDTVKLPMLARDPSGAQRPGRLAIALPDVRALRSQLALAAARSFRPDVAVVDKAPLGLGDELARALAWLRGAGTRLVLGLRDIEDEPARVRREWGRPSLRTAFERLYDAVLVYGPEGTRHHALACLGWEASVPVQNVGYLAAPPLAAATDVPPEYVLVTPGGGADGARLVGAFLDAVRLKPLPVPALVVTGPLMPEADARAVRERAAKLDVIVQTFRTDLDGAIATARAVVAMAGYNTVSELLRTGRPALLVPRTHPSREQAVRAELLRKAGRVDVLYPHELDAERMRASVGRLLATRPYPSQGDYAGAGRAVAVLEKLGRATATEHELLEEAS